MMKNALLTFTFVCLTGVLSYAQTPGELAVSTATSEAGGNYAPRNIVAIWIEDDAGNFQKTLLAYAQNRRTHLNTWQASTAASGSEYNTVDAITGPTRNSHGTRVCSWDGTDVEGNLLADGTYHVWMELTDKNQTGNYSSFAFTKSDVADNLTPFDVPSFGSISISWEPDDPTGFLEKGISEKVNLFPNPGTGVYTISGDDIDELEVRSISGKLIMKTPGQTIDISDQPDGVYLLIVSSHGAKEVYRLIKNR